MGEFRDVTKCKLIYRKKCKKGVVFSHLIIYNLIILREGERTYEKS